MRSEGARISYVCNAIGRKAREMGRVYIIVSCGLQSLSQACLLWGRRRRTISCVAILAVARPAHAVGPGSALSRVVVTGAWYRFDRSHGTA